MTVDLDSVDVVTYGPTVVIWVLRYPGERSVLTRGLLSFLAGVWDALRALGGERMQNMLSVREAHKVLKRQRHVQN